MCAGGFYKSPLVYVCARFQDRFQERELVMLPVAPVRASVPDRTMGKQLRDSRLYVDDEAEQSIDFDHRKTVPTAVAGSGS